MTRPLPQEGGPELIVRAASGDREAWRELVERHSGLVWSVIRQGGLSRDTGEDLFQDVFAEALRALPTLRDPQRFDAWLITTARRLVWKAWSARQKAPDELPAELLDANERPEALTEAQERRLLVRRGLDALPVRCRDLLLAAFASGPPPDYDLLARRLGVPRGSLGPTRARCLEQLAAALAALGLRASS